MKRDTAGLSLLYRVACLLRCPTSFRPHSLQPFNAVPYRSRVPRGGRFHQFYCLLLPCCTLLSAGSSSHDDDGRGRGRKWGGGGGGRVSRDRPRCPVLHCRSAVRRRPAHRRHHCRHHVWLGTEGGRDRSSCSLVRPSYYICFAELVESALTTINNLTTCTFSTM